MLHLRRGYDHHCTQLREHMAVSMVHRALIVKVGSIAHTAYYGLGAHTACLVARKRRVYGYLHTLIIGIHPLDKALAPLHREHTTLSNVVTNGDYYPIEDAQRLIDNGLMTSCEWVERPWEYRYSLHNLHIYNRAKIVKIFIYNQKCKLFNHQDDRHNSLKATFAYDASEAPHTPSR